jgi:trigger factor
MHSQVREIDPVTVEIHIEVPWDRVRKGLDEAFTKLQRSARVKGFRPGKVPQSILKRLFAKNVQAEVVSSLVEESVVAAVQRHELPVVSNAMLEDRPVIAEGEPLSFKVKFEVRPRVAELHTNLALTRVPPTVSDAEVDAEIERLREQHAIVRPIESERAAAKGDVLVIDYEVEIDGQVKPDMKGEGRTFQLGDGRLLEEIDNGLVGVGAGETKEIVVERPADDPNRELAGKKLVFRLTVRELRERILPDLDDEFAKDVGEYHTLLELRLAVRKRLEEAAAARAQAQLREQAIEKLALANPIPVPPSLVDQQLRAMVGAYTQVMEMIGRKPHIEQDDVEDMRRRAEQKVRAALLLGEIARRESIVVTAEEIDARMAEMAARSGRHIAKVRAEYSGEKREAIENQLLEDKLIRYLLDRAVVRDAPAEPAGASEPQSSSP